MLCFFLFFCTELPIFCTKLPYFCIVFPKNCITLSQSESRNFCMYIIRRIINTIVSICLQKYARIFVLGHYLFLEAHSFPRASLSENCSLLGTDNVRGQISVHIFAPNGDYCLYNPRDEVKGIIRQYSLRLRRIIVFKSTITHYQVIIKAIVFSFI